MTETYQGGCLCGKVQYEVSEPFDSFHICHCTQCQRSTGSAHASNIFTDKNNIRWLSGEDLVKRFDPTEPGIISKAFCTHCGSLTPYISPKSGKLIIPAGGLANDPGIRPQDNIFWKDRASWYDAISQVKKFDGFPE